MNVRIANQTIKRTETQTEVGQSIVKTTIETSYLSRRREDCRDNIDRRVYDLVIEMNDAVAIGSCVGAPA